jgi:hypothetical protein
MSRSSWFILLWVVSLACAGKSGLSGKQDASRPDAAADLASTAEHPADEASPTDMPVARVDANDAGPTERPADAAADLAPEATIGGDMPAGGDTPVEAAPTPDTASDLPSAGDVANDRGVAGDLGQDLTSGADLPAEKPLGYDLAVEARLDGDFADACQAVANSTFVSTEPHECGLTPTGPASCPWRLSFTDNGATRQLSWQLSDYSLGLVYQCNGYALTARSPGGTGATYTGTYDPATGILLWDGFNYTKQSL